MKRNILNLVIFAIIVIICLLADNFSDNPEANQQPKKENNTYIYTNGKIK